MEKKEASKHTPGPWRLDQYGSVYTADGERLLANVSFPTGNHPKAGEIHANTRLIAAAPGLLAAAEKVIYSVDNNCLDVTFTWEDELRAAIKKARGE